MTDERTSTGAPLDAAEAALLAALRAQGLHQLAAMALFCFGESRGDAEAALKELKAAQVVDELAPWPGARDWDPAFEPGLLERVDPAARARLEELAPAAARAFMGRARSVTGDEIQGWYAERGLSVGILLLGGDQVFERIELVGIGLP
jgi:hypothetical protein